MLFSGPEEEEIASAASVGDVSAGSSRHISSRFGPRLAPIGAEQDSTGGSVADSLPGAGTTTSSLSGKEPLVRMTSLVGEARNNKTSKFGAPFKAQKVSAFIMLKVALGKIFIAFRVVQIIGRDNLRTRKRLYFDENIRNTQIDGKNFEKSLSGEKPKDGKFKA